MRRNRTSSSGRRARSHPCRLRTPRVGRRIPRAGRHRPCAAGFAAAAATGGAGCAAALGAAALPSARGAALADDAFVASEAGLADDGVDGRAAVAPLPASGVVADVAGASGMRVSYFGGAVRRCDRRCGGGRFLRGFVLRSVPWTACRRRPSRGSPCSRLTNLPSSIGGIFTETSSPSGFCSVSSSIGTTTATPSASTMAPTRRRRARRRNSSTLMSAGSAIAHRGSLLPFARRERAPPPRSGTSRRPRFYQSSLGRVARRGECAVRCRRMRESPTRRRRRLAAPRRSAPPPRRADPAASRRTTGRFAGASPPRRRRCPCPRACRIRQALRG